MIPFRFNENRFSFFVADHLLVGQLCTNPKSDRSLLSCLKVIQCSTSEIGDAPLYNFCSLPIQVMTTGPLPAPSIYKSGLPRITGTCPGWWKQSFPLRLWSLVWFQVRDTSCHLSSSKSAWKSTPKCTCGCAEEYAEECGDPLVQSGGRPWVWQQDSAPAHKSKETQAWLQKECYDFVPFSHCPLPQPEPTGLLCLVIRREYHQHDLSQHQSQPDRRRHPPSIRRAPAGACGKGMLPVPDPYRGGDWGWRRLHWIDVSSTT